jgi:hypothetical protein
MPDIPPREILYTTAERNESWHARNQPHLKWLLASPSWSKRFDWLKVSAVKRRTDQKMLFTHRQFVVRFSSAVNKRRCQFSPGICPHFSFVYFAIVIDLSSCFLDGTSGTIVPCLDPDQKFTQKWKKKNNKDKKETDCHFLLMRQIAIVFCGLCVWNRFLMTTIPSTQTEKDQKEKEKKKTISLLGFYTVPTWSSS